MRSTRSSTGAVALVTMLGAVLATLGATNAHAGATFVPVGIEVDMPANHVIEPGEFPGVAPTWQNTSGGTVALTGTASNITGPPGATYGFLDTTADYGSVANGASASCWTATANCYVVSISDPATRPAMHWDISFTETLSTGQMRTWTLHVGRTFLDVSPTGIYYPFVETLVHNSITAGCTYQPGWYCASFPVTREQMAVFLLRSKEGGDYHPPPAGSSPFADVPQSSPYASWIEELVARGVTAGCGTNPPRYCPSASVTREQMGIFLLRTLNGGSYTPPPISSSSFVDVAPSSPYAPWIQDLYDRGITGGCATNPPRYCPTAAVARAGMAVFLTRTFDLVLYGL